MLKLCDDRILEITEKDVHVTLAQPIGPLEVLIGSTYKLTNKYPKLLKQWRARWNLGRTSTTKVGKIV